MTGTAVIYARFSCAKQREASIDDQVRVCEAWCATEGYRVVNVYRDEAMSGRTDDRPAFQEMVANAGESDIVLVYMMDRFSRDVYDAPIYKKKLRDKGTRVVSATEALPDGPEAMLMENIYEGLAAIESAHISMRTRRGMEGNALKCLHNGVPVFGYRFGGDGRYVVDPDEAAVVRECFARRLGGETVNSMAADLARRGYRTYRGNPVGYTFVRNMLGNEKYTGVYLWGDVRVEGGMPQIVEREDFDMVQGMRPRKQRQSEEWGEFPLSGKAICGGCAWNLVGTSGRGRNGAKYDYYRCGHKCGARPVRADWLEAEVVAGVRAVLGDRDRAREVAEAVLRFAAGNDESGARANAARRRAEEAGREIDNLTKAVRKGLDIDLVKDELDALVARKAAAEAEAVTYESAGGFDVEDFADFLQLGATLDDESLLDAFVYQVYVAEDYTDVTLNYDMANGDAARFRLEGCGSSEVASGVGADPETQVEPGHDGENLVRPKFVWLPG